MSTGKFTGNDEPSMILIRNILTENKVHISDSITTSREITQMNGVLQGDTLSPLLFNILTSDIAKALQDTPASLYMYLHRQHDTSIKR